MSIVGLVATYRDGALLPGALESARPFVDRLVVLDGAYAGLPYDLTVGRLSSSNHELNAAALAGGAVFRLGPGAPPWRGEVEKRNALLELGRALCPVDATTRRRWALVLDADEILVDGHYLNDLLELVADGVYAPGLVREEPDGRCWWAPSRLFELHDLTRYGPRSYDLSQPGRATVLEHVALGDQGAPASGLPYIRHRWNERSAWRADLQRAWGRHLAELDHGPA